MIPQTGVCAYFSFAAKLSSLDGIYQVIEIQSFADAMANSVDFVNKLYVPAGLSAADWSTDYTNYKGQDVYYLQSVQTPASLLANETVGTIYPVPVGCLAGEPDFTVNKYPNLFATMWFGAWEDPTELKWVISNINDLIATATGITDNAALKTNSDQDVWMRKADYDEQAATRKANAGTLVPNAMKIQQLTAQLAAAEDLVAYYQQQLKANLGG